MTAEIKMPAAPNCVVVIDNDGSLTVSKRCKNAYSELEECWEYVVEYIKEYSDWDDFLKRVSRGYEYWPEYGRFADISHPAHKDFDVDDLIDYLAEALKHYVAKEDPMRAIAIASALKDMPYEKWEYEPQIHIDAYEEEFSDGTGVVRSETHQLMIQEVEISEWEERTNREIIDPMYFNTEPHDYRKDYGLDELGPSEIDLAVLEALGVKEEDPDFPEEDEMGLPEIDNSGNGPFGLLYEGLYEADSQFKFQVVVYEDEPNLKNAYWLAKRIDSNHGTAYEITMVRRMTPSELATIAPIEDQPKGPVNDWVELEERWQDRPDDFDG